MSMRTFEATNYASQQSDYDAKAAQDESVSVFDRYSSFDGTFNLTRDLRVEGQVKGTISCQGTMFVAQGASVNATVDAENITVAGELDGDITCRGKLQILSTGKVHGKLSTATLVINEGAVYEGDLVMDSTGRANASGRESGRLRSTSPSAAATDSARDTDQGSEKGSVSSATSSRTFIRRFGGQETSWDGTEDSADDQASPTS